MARIHIVAVEANRSGGAGVYTHDLARHLSAAHDVTLICHDAAPALDDCCRVHRVPHRNFSNWPIVWRASTALQLMYCYRALQALPLTAPDLVIGSAQVMTWAHARRFTAAPLVYLPHSLVAPEEVRTYPSASSIRRAIMTGVFDYLECWALNRAVRTVRFSDAARRALVDYYGARASARFAVLPVPIDVPEPSVKTSSTTARLLYVGRLVSTKNVHLLIDALGELRDLDWSCDVVGDGPERESLQAAAAAHRLSERITFHGHKHDVGPFYKAADLLLFPSRLESHGLVLLEAMSHATPTLSIRADGRRFRNVNHEVVDSGRDGFIADDEPQFVRLLAALIDDRDRLAAAGARARARVSSGHAWESHVAAYDELLHATLAA